MSTGVSKEPAGQQESSLQYETHLKIHFKMKNEKMKSRPISFVFLGFSFVYLNRKMGIAGMLQK
jgi:hypothetical protein